MTNSVRTPLINGVPIPTGNGASKRRAEKKCFRRTTSFQHRRNTNNAIFCYEHCCFDILLIFSKVDQKQFWWDLKVNEDEPWDVSLSAG
jgi:hypothetical protein